MCQLSTSTSVHCWSEWIVEFRAFVDHTEKELFALFHSIDRDQDNRLDKIELQAAFQRAGLVVPKAKLNQFFAEVDENNDVSYITYLICTFC